MLLPVPSQLIRLAPADLIVVSLGVEKEVIKKLLCGLDHDVDVSQQGKLRSGT